MSDAMTRRALLQSAAVAGAALAAQPWLRQVRAQSSASRRPNVVIISTDDRPKSQFGCYGGMETPHIDAIAAGGVRLTRFYVSTGLCAPSRYSLQTGRYPSSSPCILREFPAGGPACPVQQIGDEHNRPAERFNLPWTMKQAGYATGIVGKWHQGFMGERFNFGSLDDKPVDDPEVQAGLKHNFDLAQKAAHAAGYDFAEALYHDNVQPGNFPKCVSFHNPEWVTHHALRFMQTHKDQPFFLVVNPTLVHYPPEADSLKADPRITALDIDETIPKDIMPSRESVLKRAEQRGLKGNHDAGAIWLDDSIGAIAKKLDDLGLADDTIVMVISDNGTGGKWSCYEGGVNTGAIIRWKGKIDGGKVCDDLVANVDIAPTVFDLCGVKPGRDLEMHGVSQAGLLARGEKAPRESLYLEFGYQRAVVGADGMKYLAVRYPKETHEKVLAGESKLDLAGRARGKPATLDELFDIKADPHERKNLVADPSQSARLAELRVQMKRYSAQLPHTFGEFKQ